MKTINQTTNNLIITINNNSTKLAWLITGLIQSDGSFGMRIIKYKDSFRIRLVLVIEMTMDSFPLLSLVRAYFGCGIISVNQERNTCVFTVTSVPELWHIIVPHFLKYPLYGAKYLSFYKFLGVLTLIYPIRGRNSDKLILAKAVLLGWDINGSNYRSDEDIYDILNKLLPSLSEYSIAEIFTSKEAVNKKILRIEAQLVGRNESGRNILSNPLTLRYLEENKTQTINPYFILGIIEGDGSFYVGLRENGKIRFGFNITTSSDDIMLLFSIKRALGCGNVKFKSESWCRFEVEGNKDLRNTLMLIVKLSPFGDRLLGSKSKNYDIFQKVMEIFLKKGHMKKEGLKQIAQLVYSGSTQKNRKLTLEEYLTKHNLN